MQQRQRRGRTVWHGSAGAFLAFGLVAAACGDDGDTESIVEPATTDEPSAAQPPAVESTVAEPSRQDRTINVAIVNNPQMADIVTLTPELFTADTGIDVNYTVLEEQALREITTRDVSSGGEEFDVVMIGMYEAPQFGASGWITDLTSYADADDDYDVDDILPTVRRGLSYDGGLYASPFYAESSFVMYRDDLLAAAGQTMPDEPTWDEVAAIARAVDTDEVAGICLRGQPGWGELGASFTTVLNTFGGTWWLANDDGSIGDAQVDQPEFAAALNFYVDLLNDAGEDDAANSGFGECLGLYQDGKVAMWYDATVAAGLLEADDSAVMGLNGFALAPTKVTGASGWLWAWSLAIPATAADPDTAWEFISWATSAGYIQSAGEALPGGWAAIPPGTRASTYANAKYLAASEAFAQKTLDAMNAAPIDDPGLTPRPGLPGVQYVGVPEFQDVGTRCTRLFSAAIAGSMSVEDALDGCQDIAAEVSS